MSERACTCVSLLSLCYALSVFSALFRDRQVDTIIIGFSGHGGRESSEDDEERVYKCDVSGVAGHCFRGIYSRGVPLCGETSCDKERDGRNGEFRRECGWFEA